MRKLLLIVIAGLALLCASAFPVGAQHFKSEKQAMRARHKAERRALKMNHKFAKQSLKNQPTSRGVRLQFKHRMHRERRELRERHKDEAQDLNDRQRVLKESQRLL